MIQENRKDFFIKEDRLAKALEIKLVDFDQIISDLESGLNNQFQLKELIHFKYRNKTQKIRIFSREGALAIANYLDICRKANEIALDKVLSIIEEFEISIIDSSIRQIVSKNSSSLIFRGQRHWLNIDDTFKIFKTTKSRLNQAFESIQRSDSYMERGEDFDYFENVIYFTFSGLEKLSIELVASLYSASRREYCKRVPLIATPVLEYLALPPSEDDIAKAMRYATNRNKKACQVTGYKRDKYNSIKLVRHHLFDQNTYRFLASDPDNIITVCEQISDEFHQWNGGTHKSCTIDDFAEFIDIFYYEKHELIVRIARLREVLQVKLLRFQRNLPEGNH